MFCSLQGHASFNADGFFSSKPFFFFPLFLFYTLNYLQTAKKSGFGSHPKGLICWLLQEKTPHKDTQYAERTRASRQGRFGIAGRLRESNMAQKKEKNKHVWKFLTQHEPIKHFKHCLDYKNTFLYFFKISKNVQHCFFFVFFAKSCFNMYLIIIITLIWMIYRIVIIIVI